MGRSRIDEEKIFRDRYKHPGRNGGELVHHGLFGHTILVCHRTDSILGSCTLLDNGQLQTTWVVGRLTKFGPNLVCVGHSKSLECPQEILRISQGRL